MKARRTGCHTCPTHAEIMAGMHRETPWQSMPCATCPLAKEAHGANDGGRALRGRVGMTRLSLDYETVEIIEAERELHPLPPPEIQEAEAAPVRVCDTHRQLLTDLMHAPDPESMTAILTAATEDGATVALALMLLRLNPDGLWSVLQRLRGAEPGAVAAASGTTGAASHGRIKSVLLRLPSHVREVIHPHVLRSRKV
jgi:hypothetical protein